MSITAARDFIKSHILNVDQKLGEALLNQRDALNKRITVLDVGLASISVNMHPNSADPKFIELYNKFIEVLRIYMQGRTYPSLEAALMDRGKDRLLFDPILIDSPAAGRFIAAAYFGAAQKIVKEVSEHPELISTDFGKFQRYNEKTGKWSDPQVNLELGHISTVDSPNLTSPLEEKLHNLYVHFKGNNALTTQIGASLQELYDIQKDYTYEFKNTTPEQIASTRSILGLGYIVVTLHMHDKNQAFSRREAAIENKLLMKIAASINPTEIPGSNTILEDIRAGLIAALAGKKGPPKHEKVTGKVSTKKKGKVTATTVAGTVKSPPIRNVQGQFYSLTSLQVLINASLQHVISANMGDQPYPGGQRKILNYRTGRFAASAQVERLSQSRTGMITAFYSYMKYPYQTFEPGFAQGSPESRDPKLLVSKSIREIAATKVGNRMRAVLV